MGPLCLSEALFFSVLLGLEEKLRKFCRSRWVKVVESSIRNTAATSVKLSCEGRFVILLPRRDHKTFVTDPGYFELLCSVRFQPLGCRPSCGNNFGPRAFSDLDRRVVWDIFSALAPQVIGWPAGGTFVSYLHI